MNDNEFTNFVMSGNVRLLESYCTENIINSNKMHMLKILNDNGIEILTSKQYTYRFIDYRKIYFNKFKIPDQSTTPHYCSIKFIKNAQISILEQSDNPMNIINISNNDEIIKKIINIFAQLIHKGYQINLTMQCTFCKIFKKGAAKGFAQELAQGFEQGLKQSIAIAHKRQKIEKVEQTEKIDNKEQLTQIDNKEQPNQIDNKEQQKLTDELSKKNITSCACNRLKFSSIMKLKSIDSDLTLKYIEIIPYYIHISQPQFQIDALNMPIIIYIVD
uniref:Uncharacterized protein n=1 Tax=viral metagenome TaxID=1070528 RepID=A0A6C0HLU6_9ZZZZ